MREEINSVYGNLYQGLDIRAFPAGMPPEVNGDTELVSYTKGGSDLIQKLIKKVDKLSDINKEKNYLRVEFIENSNVVSVISSLSEILYDSSSNIMISGTYMPEIFELKLTVDVSIEKETKKGIKEVLEEVFDFIEVEDDTLNIYIRDNDKLICVTENSGVVPVDNLWIINQSDFMDAYRVSDKRG